MFWLILAAGGVGCLFGLSRLRAHGIALVSSRFSRSWHASELRSSHNGDCGPASHLRWPSSVGRACSHRGRGYSLRQRKRGSDRGHINQRKMHRRSGPPEAPRVWDAVRAKKAGSRPIVWRFKPWRVIKLVTCSTCQRQHSPFPQIAPRPKQPRS